MNAHRKGLGCSGPEGGGVGAAFGSGDGICSPACSHGAWQLTPLRACLIFGPELAGQGGAHQLPPLARRRCEVRLRTHNFACISHGALTAPLRLAGQPLCDACSP